MAGILETIKKWLGAAKSAPAVPAGAGQNISNINSSQTSGSAAKKPVIQWAAIPEGTFFMGSPAGETDRFESELRHPVKLNAFRMSRYEITMRQFKAFVDATGYFTDAEKGTGFKGSFLWNGKDYKAHPEVNWRHDEYGRLRPEDEFNHPVLHVSWHDAVAFARWIECRLPTEAEWEYACRAGTETPFNTGENVTTAQANYNGNFPYKHYAKGEYREKTVPVGSFPPNQWGLYDMHGNVFEWCSDWYGEYPEEAQVNPAGPEKGLLRVRRGGSWGYFARDCRSAFRNCRDESARSGGVGFRIVSGPE